MKFIAVAAWIMVLLFGIIEPMTIKDTIPYVRYIEEYFQEDRYNISI